MTTQEQTNQRQSDTNDGQDAKNVATTYELKILHQQLDQLRERYEEKIETLETKLEGLQRDRDNALVWGIVTLGAAVVSMGLWIFKTVTKHS